MGKKTDEGFMKLSKKFDIPIFTASWAAGKAAGTSKEDVRKAKEAMEGLVVFSGGGGEGKHGVKSKIIMAKYNSKEGELSAEVLSVSTEDKPAFKLAVHPKGDAIIASFEKGCKVFHLRLKKEDDSLSFDESGTQIDALPNGVEQKCVVFSPDGTKVAFGDEEGRVLVLEWPSLEIVMDVKKGHTTSLKDADFDLEGAYLATTADSGPGRVWDISEGTAVATLSLLQGCRLGLCRFSRDERKPFLFGTVVKGGKGWIVVWNTSSWKQLGVKKLHDEPISGFAVNPDSSLLATGTADGAVAVVDMKKMRILQRVPGAHMVFVTALQFSPDGSAVLSVSGDSSVRITPVTVKPSGPRPWHGVLLFLFVFLLSIALAVLFANSEFAQRFFQFPLGKDQPAFPYLKQWPQDYPERVTKQYSPEAYDEL